MTSFRKTAVALASLASMGLGASACGDCGSSSTSSSSSADASQQALAEDGGQPSAADVGAPAASPCAGMTVDLAAVVSDPTCAITGAIAKSARAIFEMAEDAGRHSLEQRAMRLDDGRVELRLLNKGTLPAAVPLSWHPKIPAFIVLADNPKEKAIYELEPPVLAVDLDGGPATARFARATISPGGYAFARIAINPKITKRAGKSAGDAGPVPAELGAGKWTLHIGQLVTDVFTGEPATLPWLVEATD